jgi:hypothetical protein
VEIKMYQNKEYRDLILGEINRNNESIVRTNTGNSIMYSCRITVLFNDDDSAVWVVDNKLKLYDNIDYNNEILPPYKYFDGLGVTEEEYYFSLEKFNMTEYSKLSPKTVDPGIWFNTPQPAAGGPARQ